MNTHAIDAATMQKAFLAGANRINQQKEYINELNVFPVPDGDTGTNMTLTIMSAANEVKQLENPTIRDLCKAISSGSLRGARGNSGVILSQLFRGFTKAVSRKDVLTCEDISSGFNRAVETAYKAVMKPKEGTILTVAREMAEKAQELLLEDMDLNTYCESIVSHGYDVLARTPDLLPVLKEAGVVDSGGQGLMEVLQGVVDSLSGRVSDVIIPESTGTARTISAGDLKEGSAADIKFGYCTEFIIMLESPLSEEQETELKEYLLSIGDSLVLVADDDLCKVHVHSNHPGLAFEKALTYGALSNMKIDNMRLEHQEKLIKNAEKVAAQQRLEDARKAAQKAEPPKQPPEKYGFISVSAGEGLSEIFKSLGVDCLIEGGQTMNPSTEDMLNAIEQVNAEHIFILPNNKNIILAAEQARDLTEDKDIIVMSTTTIPQGIAAMINFMAESDVEENKTDMEEGYRSVASGQVTYAVRDTVINGIEIHKGNIMGLNDDGISAVGEDICETTRKLIQTMINEYSEIISLYYGAEIREEDAQALAAMIEKDYPEMEVEIHFGGQPVYYYLISVE